MSQEAVERLLGRLLTDEMFRKRARDSITGLCRKFGYDLNASEISSVSRNNFNTSVKLAKQLSVNV